MTRYFKRFVTPRVILFLGSVVLFAYVRYTEYQVEKLVGCWDCGWESRQAILLVLAVAGLLFARWWTLAISVLLGLKVLYSIGYVAFWNNIAEVHGFWRILKSSLRWSTNGHLEFFVLLVFAAFVVCYAAVLLRRSVSK